MFEAHAVLRHQAHFTQYARLRCSPTFLVPNARMSGSIVKSSAQPTVKQLSVQALQWPAPRLQI
jgi:hypothetical protein